MIYNINCGTTPTQNVAGWRDTLYSCRRPYIYLFIYIYTHTRLGRMTWYLVFLSEARPYIYTYIFLLEAIYIYIYLFIYMASNRNRPTRYHVNLPHFVYIYIYMWPYIAKMFVGFYSPLCLPSSGAGLGTTESHFIEKWAKQIASGKICNWQTSMAEYKIGQKRAEGVAVTVQLHTPLTLFLSHSHLVSVTPFTCSLSCLWSLIKSLIRLLPSRHMLQDCSLSQFFPCQFPLTPGESNSLLCYL